MKQTNLFSLKRCLSTFKYKPLFFAENSSSQSNFESDILSTAMGDLKMTFIGHASLMFEIKDLVIHIDPVMEEADYSKLPKADIIIITHNHYDHLDLDAINHIQQSKTKFVLTENCIENIDAEKTHIILKNGENRTIENINIKAVPAYNILHMNSPGNPFHPKGEGNGYILNFEDTNVYIAGDTENIPEMKEIKNIDVAFLPMNLPYTMTPKMVADAAKSIKPKILYPYHFGETNTNELTNLLKKEKNIETRIRKLQ